MQKPRLLVLTDISSLTAGVREVHVIVTVTDSGEPTLSSYARVLVRSQ